MGRCYSMDLRERVTAFVAQGHSRPAFPRCARGRVRCEVDFGILYKGIVGSSGVRHGQHGG
jgi:ribosomal protein L37AE/L43A